MISFQRKFVSSLYLIGCPFLVMANAGSPMMWFGIIHALFLNLLIGKFESHIVSRLGVRNNAWIIVIGNYASAIIGLQFIAPKFSTINGNHDFWGGKTRYGEYGLDGFFAGMLVSYLVTIVIEIPFFLSAAKRPINLKKTILSSLAANSITNVIMFLLYLAIVSSGSKH